MEVQRYDFYNAKELQKATKTAQGFLRAPIYATRVGIFKYILPDGSVRREFRPPEEVFKEDSLATMRGVPITLKHPLNMVDPTNARGLTIGHTSEHVEVVDDKFVKTLGTITDGESIEKVERGDMVEVSMGYNANVIETPGVYQGEEYDAIQTDIVYNHLAIVDKGRAGKDVRIRLDDNTAILYDEEKYKRLQKGDNMEKIKIGDSEFEVEKKVADAFNAFKKKNDEMMEKLKGDTEVSKDEEKKAKDMESKAKDEKEKAEAKADSLEVEVTTLKSKLEKAGNRNDAAEMDKLVNERISVLGFAKKILGDDYKTDGVSNLEIKKAVILKTSPEIKLDEKSEVYVEARFDSIVDLTGNSEEKVDHLADFIKVSEGNIGGQGDVISSEKSRRDSMASDANAWQVGLGNE